MIITCPHCQTKYQVTYEAIGSAGRKVQCAHCQQAWQQSPLDKEPPPTPEQAKASEAFSEDSLDEAMEAEERKVAAKPEPAPPPSPPEAKPKAAKPAKPDKPAKGKKAESGKSEASVAKQRQKDFFKRQSAIVAGLPVARLRRTLRIVGTLALVGVVAGAYFERIAVVERFPAMAGVYEAVGLGVNVVGLEFSDVTTMQSLRDGQEVLAVSAQIVGLMPRPVAVPAVVVTLLDGNGQGIYEWSVSPAVQDLMAGERATFNTQLTMPPGDAARVRLSFAGGPSTPLDEPGHASTEGHDGAAGGHDAETAPAESADHAAPAEHGETTDHAAPAEHGATTDHAAPAEHGETTDPAAPAEHGAATDHAAPAEHGETTDHAAPEAPSEHPTPEHH